MAYAGNGRPERTAGGSPVTHGLPSAVQSVLFPNHSLTHPVTHLVEQRRRVPKIIWCYWHTGAKNLPKLVRLAIASWKTFAPEHEIRIVDSGSWMSYIQADLDLALASNPRFADWLREASRAHFADWLRLALLKIHGGVWLDATILLTSPIDCLLNLGTPSTDLIVVTLGSIVETYFFAAVPNGRIITLWQHEFQRVMTMSDWEFRSYLALMSSQGMKPLNGMWEKCPWSADSGPSKLAEVVWKGFVSVVNSIIRVVGLRVDACGEDWWTNYLRTNVAMNAIVGVVGSQPETLWGNWGIQALPTERLNLANIKVGWNGGNLVSYLMTRQSADFPLNGTCGIKLRSGDRDMLQSNTWQNCESSSAMCKLQQLVGEGTFGQLQHVDVKTPTLSQDHVFSWTGNCFIAIVFFVAASLVFWHAYRKYLKSWLLKQKWTPSAVADGNMKFV